MAFRAVTYRGRDAAADDRGFAGTAFRAVTYRTKCALNYVKVLQVWRFEQLLTLSPIKSEKSGLRKYDVSSSYLPKDAG